MNPFWFFVIVAVATSTIEDDRDLSDENFLFDEADKIFGQLQHVTSEQRQEYLNYFKNAGIGHCLSSKRKSPIHIDLDTVKMVSLPPLKFENYDESESVSERNMKINFFTSIAGFTNWTRQPVLSGGPLEGNYHLMEINWDTDLNQRQAGTGWKHYPLHGHTISNSKPTFEIHFLHTKEGIPVYEAQEYSDGIVILVVFIDVVQKMDYYAHNLTNREKHKIHETPGTEFEWVSPNHFLPKERDAFFVYEGSFSHPPCNGDVKWILLSEPLRWNFMENEFPSSKTSVNNVFELPYFQKKTNPNVRYNNPKLIQTQCPTSSKLTTVVLTSIVVGVLFLVVSKYLKKKNLPGFDSDAKGILNLNNVCL